MAEDYYSILGVGRTASPNEIRAAYLRLARSHHPDRFKNPAERETAARRFQLISESFNHLRDERLRREYDRSLEDQAVPPKRKAEQRHRDGQLLEQSREYSQALKYFYEAMQLDPDEAVYRLAAARVLGKDRSKHRQAAELLEQTIARSPGLREAYVQLGALYSVSGMFTRACRVYERGLKELPGDSELRTLLAQAASSAKTGKR